MHLCAETEKTKVMEGRKETDYLMMHSTHFIYSYIVKDHSYSEKGTRCHYMGYSFRLAARVLLYAPSHRQDSTYHILCYTSRTLAGTRNNSVSTMSKRSYHRAKQKWWKAVGKCYFVLQTGLAVVLKQNSC